MSLVSISLSFLLIFTIYVVAVGGAVTVTVALSGRDPPSSSNPATASSDSSQPDDALPVDAASKST
jgi:hypothetical protein